MIGLTSCPGGQSIVTNPGTGRLVRWSDQAADSPYKLVLLPGCVNTNDPNGLNLREMEDYFDQLIKNFGPLGIELLGEPIFDRVELWFYGYYPTQPIDKIAQDAVAAIKDNRNFDNSCIAIVGHSEGGVVVWLIDQRHEVMAGGIPLGAPILSTPVADKSVRDAAVKRSFLLADAKLISAFDQLAIGTEQLRQSYLETGQPKTRLMFFAGRVKAPPATFWQRNLTLLNALAASGDNFFGGARSNRDFSKLGAMIIANSDWGNSEKLDDLSDGLVPESSSTLSGQEPYSVWPEYDHWDLISGKGDLSLHREMLRWLIKVWGLRRVWIDADLPETPDIIELPTDVNDSMVWARLAYINADGQLTLTDESWERLYTLPVAGVHGHPQFDDTGGSLVFDVDDNGTSNIYVISGSSARQISFDGRSRCPTWSPNEQWLAYQSAGNLVIHQLNKGERYVVASQIDQLIGAPVWTVSRLQGRLYFVSETRELRWVSPRERGASSTTLIQSDCGRPLMGRGPANLSGLVVISDSGSTDGVTHQRVTIVTGALTNHFSADISYVPDEWNVDYDYAAGRITLWLDRPFSFTEAVYDVTYNHLYLVGEWDGVCGIYLLDIQAFLDWDRPKSELKLSEFFSLRCKGAAQLAIRPSP